MPRGTPEGARRAGALGGGGARGGGGGSSGGGRSRTPSAAIRALLRKARGGGVTPTVEPTTGNMRPYSAPREAYARQKTRAPRAPRPPQNAREDKGPGAREGQLRVNRVTVKTKSGETKTYKPVTQVTGSRWGYRATKKQEQVAQSRYKSRREAESRKAQYEDQIEQLARRMARGGEPTKSDRMIARIEVRDQWKARVARERQQARVSAEVSRKSVTKPKRPGQKPKGSQADPTAKKAIERADEARMRAEAARLKSERLSGSRRTVEARVERVRQAEAEASNRRARERYAAERAERARNPRRLTAQQKQAKARQQKALQMARAKQARAKAERVLRASGGAKVGKVPRPLTAKEEAALVRRRMQFKGMPTD